ncbi:polysaccharide biosynthesis protein [Planktomarina temperata]|nr:polysaccharide biosynthesis protein [Planktomarina temperata]
MSNFFKNKSVAITGACGSVGSELVKKLALQHHEVAEIKAVDNNESELFFLEQKYLSDKRVKVSLTDVSDKETLGKIFEGVDVVFHCAALKHVVMCERSPEIAINTNIYGVRNVISACELNHVRTLIFTSSDKAVNPTNVMGTSKLMGERLITAANSSVRKRDSIFASTRFGNVLGSNGSVLPIFYSQILSGQPVTITDTEMTRFIMSIDQAVELVLNSAVMAKGGEVFVTKMPVVRIVDLAEALVAELFDRSLIKNKSIRINLIGKKPGEKLYEELMNDEEMRRSVELKEYFSVLPAFRGMHHETRYCYEDVVSNSVRDPYHSGRQTVLSIDEIRQYFRDNYIIEKLTVNASNRYWPGDKEVNER